MMYRKLYPHELLEKKPLLSLVIFQKKLSTEPNLISSMVNDTWLKMVGTHSPRSVGLGCTNSGPCASKFLEIDSSLACFNILFSHFDCVSYL